MLSLAIITGLEPTAASAQVPSSNEPPAMPARPSLFGPPTEHPKSGDPAPPLSFTRTLHTVAGSPSWSGNFAGFITIVAFYPDTSHNLQSVTLWNELIEHTAGKPFRFVWITSEQTSTLTPSLNRHPVSGWVFEDPQNLTARSYGLDFPNIVFIGMDGRIVGFDRGFVPNQQVLDLVLERRTAPVQKLDGTIEPLSPRPIGLPHIERRKPAFPPSNAVHISATTLGQNTTGTAGGDDFLSLEGFDLRGLIARVYGVDSVCIELPQTVDPNIRYDVSLNLPAPATEGAMYALIHQAIEDRFQLTAARVSRPTDVYVVSALADPPRSSRAVPAADKDNTLRGSSVSFVLASPRGASSNSTRVGIDDINGISIPGATIDDLCETLERSLDRPVVNETQLQGTFDFDLKATSNTGNDLLAQLRSKMDLVIQPSNRTIEILIFQAR